MSIYKDLQREFGHDKTQPKPAIVDYANPNYNGVIGLVCFHNEGWCVVEPESDPDSYADPSCEMFGFDEDRARAFYEKRVSESADKPNWDLQREYDAEHGTENGQDPNIAYWNSFHSAEMGDY